MQHGLWDNTSPLLLTYVPPSCVVIFFFTFKTKTHSHSTKHNKNKGIGKKKTKFISIKYATSCAKRKTSSKEQIENREPYKIRYWGVALPI